MRDFIEIVSILASNSQNASFHRKNLETQKCSNWPKTSFFHQTKVLPDSTFCSSSLFWSENAWFYWNREYFSFQFAKRCILQWGLVNAKMSQIGLKQAFFHQTKALSDNFLFCITILKRKRLILLKLWVF